MRKIGKLLFGISLVVSAYVIFLLLDYYFFKIHSVTIGMIRELMTIPIIGVSHILTVATLVLWRRHKWTFPSYICLAFILSLCSSIAFWL